MTSSDRDPKLRFSNRVADYVRYRPGYPVDVVRTLEQELDVAPARTHVVDIGAGTGISAELFLREGYRVTGVEPNGEMRRAAEQLLVGFEKFRAVDGSAEATTLESRSADLVTIAQAFHWFDEARARREIERILGAVPRVAVMWNDRRVDSTPFLRRYEAALRRWSIDYAKVSDQYPTDEQMAAFFGPRGGSGRTFENHQDFDWEGLLGRVLSSSYVPVSGQPGHDELIADLRSMFDEHASAGHVRFDYVTRLYFGLLS